MTFAGIYARNEWNGRESRSGPGSGYTATRQITDAIKALVRGLHIRSVLNVACGDDLWMPPLPRYMGMDIVPEAIQRARIFHPERAYEVRDARDELPEADLVICRDAIQHLTLADGRKVVENVRKAGRYALISTFLNTVNFDIAEGAAYSPNLTAEPFNLPMPSMLIFDGWDYTITGRVRDPQKFLGLWKS